MLHISPVLVFVHMCLDVREEPFEGKTVALDHDGLQDVGVTAFGGDLSWREVLYFVKGAKTLSNRRWIASRPRSSPRYALALMLCSGNARTIRPRPFLQSITTAAKQSADALSRRVDIFISFQSQVHPHSSSTSRKQVGLPLSGGGCMCDRIFAEPSSRRATVQRLCVSEMARVLPATYLECLPIPPDFVYSIVRYPPSTDLRRVSAELS
eukprot:scaffold55510_cov37-Cyclotella_meneghiniana.AAC.2